jgi:hypothetical protein
VTQPVLHTGTAHETFAHLEARDERMRPILSSQKRVCFNPRLFERLSCHVGTKSAAIGSVRAVETGQLVPAALDASVTDASRSIKSQLLSSSCHGRRHRVANSYSEKRKRATTSLMRAVRLASSQIT